MKIQFLQGILPFIISCTHFHDWQSNGFPFQQYFVVSLCLNLEIEDAKKELQDARDEVVCHSELLHNWRYGILDLPQDSPRFDTIQKRRVQKHKIMNKIKCKIIELLMEEEKFNSKVKTKKIEMRKTSNSIKKVQLKLLKLIC